MLRSGYLTMTMGTLLMAGSLAVSAHAAEAAANALPTTNPFAKASTLPFQAPPFDKIKDSDYQPALEAGMREQAVEIEKIANDKAAPTFANTIEAMEKTGALLHRVEAVFNAVSGANTNPVLQKLQEDIAPKLAAHQDAIHLNPKLFARIEAVYQQRHALKLDPEALRLVEYDHQEFVHAGARLSDADKTQLKKLNEEESTLSAQFSNKLLAATNAGALVVDDKARLAGFSDADIAAAASAAKDAQAGRQMGDAAAEHHAAAGAAVADGSRHAREALQRRWTRAERGDANDTRDIISRIARIRAEKAKLLGFPDYAAWNARRPDGEDAGGRRQVHERSGAGGDRQGAGGSGRHPGR